MKGNSSLTSWTLAKARIKKHKERGATLATVSRQPKAVGPHEGRKAVAVRLRTGRAPTEDVLPCKLNADKRSLIGKQRVVALCR